MDHTHRVSSVVESWPPFGPLAFLLPGPRPWKGFPICKSNLSEKARDLSSGGRITRRQMTVSTVMPNYANSPITCGKINVKRLGQEY
ncbi:hypothetical protein CEXT_173731 [Caerostris extrusa]|uniref:Uncharacterized protein n=1 Tax=Caerostris extrusa TaxID=172846 RepID=A0AAV4MUC1_CAEEX|nr:hypothetical protein CEXT_173731 [Caerostris extrusa]